MGRKLVLNGTKLTDTAAPKLPTVDYLESAGSLVLVDLTHPAGSWASGVPANNYQAPNVLGSMASAAFGETAADWNPIWRSQSGPNGAATIIRTTRGGIYVSGQYAGLRPSARTVQHILDNPGHAYYVSLWGARDSTSGHPTVSQIKDSNSGAAPALYNLRAEYAEPTNTVTGSSGFPLPSTGNKYRTTAAVSSSGMVGADGATVVNANGAVLFGTWGNLGDGARRTYRYYLEDLTISGRTFAQVDALDAELYEAEVSNPGGRYYGDQIA